MGRDVTAQWELMRASSSSNCFALITTPTICHHAHFQNDLEGFYDLKEFIVNFKVSYA